MAEGVDGELPLRIGGLTPQLDDLRAQRERVHLQIVHAADAPVDLEILREQDILADAQVVDPLRHGPTVHEGIGAGRAAGDGLKRTADAPLHFARDVNQLVHLFRRGPDGAVAREIYADAAQMHVRQLPLHMHAGFDHLLAIPEALAQVAEVGHDDDAVRFFLPRALARERVEHRALALQRAVALAHHIRQLREPRNPDQQIRPFDPGLAAANDLFDAARAELSDAGLLICTDDFRQAVDTLDDAADGNAARTAARRDLLCVAADPACVHLQPGELAVHLFSPLKNPANIPVCKFIIAYLLDRCHTILRRTPRKGIPRPDVTNM